MKTPPYLAAFDSASGMLRATAHFLAGRGFPRLGNDTLFGELVLDPLTCEADLIPQHWRNRLYAWLSAGEALPRERIGEVSGEGLAQWAAGSYPHDGHRQYPAVAVGSSNGALVHLYAALGIPWLPQTFLVPIASPVEVDEPTYDLVQNAPLAQQVVERNPDLVVHHMHDPAQDRLTLSGGMTYFRVKLLRLGAAYTRFLERHLAPGGTIFVVECQRHWPVTLTGERRLFQFGALGGTTVHEYFHGGPRIAAYLCQYGAGVQHWNPPAPNAVRPEAEWGFAPELRGDVSRLARERGWRVRRIVFDHPMAISPLVADLYRWWYARLGRPHTRLIADSFILMDPYWTLQTGSVPFWMLFSMDASADALARYVAAAGGMDEIYLMLFQNGVHSPGEASVARWKALLRQARRRGAFLGMTPSAFPSDFAAFARYDRAMRREISARYPLPRSLTLAELDAFLAEHGAIYPVRWIEGEGTDAGAEAQGMYATGDEQVPPPPPPQPPIGASSQRPARG